MRRFCPLLILFVAFVSAVSAQATPFFARTYHFSCQTCHSGVPRLNTFGIAFRNNNFRIPGSEKMAPLAWQKTIPLAVQVQPTEERFSPGRFRADFTDTQLLAGGLLTRSTSFYIHHSLWIDDKPVEFPSYEVWVQQVLNERYKVMLKAGQFELPYAYSPGINRVTVMSPLLFGAGIQKNDVRLGAAMRGLQLSALAPGGTHWYLAFGAPSVLSTGNTVGRREFFGEFRDVFVRVASPDPARNISAFIYSVHPTRDPADPGSGNAGQRYGLEGTLICNGYQFNAMAVYGENSNPLGDGHRGIVQGGFLEVDKMLAPWVGVTVRGDIQTIIAATHVNSDALTLSVRFYPISHQRYLRLTAEYQAADHGNSSTAIQASVAF